MIWLASAFAAAPLDVVVSFDNGGFNLPLYTPRWNGRFEQPSVAQQVMADLSRTLGRSPRVYTYLPPGRASGRSSDPFEVMPRTPDCVEEPCVCPPGEQCWSGLDVNMDPAGSTSLYQAVTALRSRAEPERPRLEIHFTDLFEEDPASATNLADADRCVTADSTRKAVEALVHGERSLDHVAVGRLSAQIVPPMRPAGGAVTFVEAQGGCWTARRLGTFGGRSPAVELAMGVVVLGFGTAGSEDQVQAVLETLPRQVSSPLALDMVVVREPVAQLSVVPLELDARAPVAGVPMLPRRSTPCTRMQGAVQLRSGEHLVGGDLHSTCEGGGQLALDEADLHRAFHRQAGLDPRVERVGVAGRLLLQGDTDAVLQAVRGLPERSPVRDRPLPFWGALVEALQVGDVARPRMARIVVEGIEVTGVDRRPWTWAGLFGVFVALLTTLGVYVALTRFAANRAFRRYLHAGSDAPVASVLQAASAASREGWAGRLFLALLLGMVVGTGLFYALLKVGVSVG